MGQLKLNIKKLGGRVWAELIWFEDGSVAATCEQDSESSAPIKCGESID